MAKKHLSEDEIKYVISAESSKAQEEIHQLAKETKKLRSEERERKKAMVELEAQGKKNSEEYNNLAKECKEYTKRISENNKKEDELRRKLNLSAMTMTQLKKEARELTNALDNMSEAANPEEYARLNSRLGEVRNRMGELRSSGRNLNDEFGNSVSWMSKLKLAAKAFIAVQVVGWLKSAHDQAYETRKEFAKYEAVLRNTFQSQEKANDAMKMLQQLAADTPASLQEWTEAYIKLVNRGVKPTSMELTNMGDLAASQGKSVEKLIEAILDAMTGENERLKEFGIKASKSGETTKFTFRGVTTEVRNSEEAIKDYMLSLGRVDGIAGSMAVQMQELEGIQSNLGDTMDSFFNKVGKKLEPFWKGVMKYANEFFTELGELFTSYTETYETHFDKMVQLESSIPGLLSRYEDLTSKSSRSAEEQKELASVILQIRNMIPGAVSAFDEYGRAISISGEKVEEFLVRQRALLKYENSKAISETQEQLDKYKETLKALQEQYLNGKTNIVAQGMFAAPIVTVDSSDKTKDKIDEEIENYQTLILGAETRLKKLNGQTVEEAIKQNQKLLEVRQNFNKMEQVQLQAWIKNNKDASGEYAAIAQEIYDKRFPTTTPTKDKSDPNAVSLKNNESDHEAEINEIRLAGREKQQAEEEINLAILISDKSYYNERIKLLEQFKTNATKSAKKAEYQKQIVDAKSKLIDTEVAMEKQKVTAIEKMRQDDSEKEKTITKSQEMYLINELAAKHISQQQYEMMMLSLSSASAETRLAIEQRYQNDVNDLELKSGKLKADVVQQANTAVLSAEQNAANARAAIQTKMNDLVKDFKSQFKLTTVDEDLEAQQKVLDAAYQARKELAEKENLDTTELTAAYNRAKEQLESEHQNRIRSIREQYGLTTQQERFNAELEQLKLNLDQKLLNEEQYEQAVQNLKRDSYKKQFDYYSDLFSGAVQALQQAEMDNVDAQYDAEIEAAKGDAEEVERLENEKAQKKLDIQKKYADVNFAIKASQIVADTAVSIMKAIADLGPIAGPIAAALMGITGVAQLASAKAERDKVKNMTLSGSTSSSSGSGARVATGRQDGGKIDVRRAQDGKLFPDTDYDPNVRGFIDHPTVIVGEGLLGQSKEWVASNAAVSNPTVAPILDILDQSQQAGTIRTLDLNQAIRARMAGYSSGGSINSSISTTPVQPNNAGSTFPPELMERFANAVIRLDEEGLPPAPVLLSELERKQELRDRARSIGSKK